LTHLSILLADPHVHNPSGLGSFRRKHARAGTRQQIHGQQQRPLPQPKPDLDPPPLNAATLVNPVPARPTPVRQAGRLAPRLLSKGRPEPQACRGAR